MQPLWPIHSSVWLERLRRAQNLKDKEAIAVELAAAELRIASTPRGLALLRRCVLDRQDIRK